MNDKHTFVSGLADGYSTQAKTTNSFWIVLIISSIIALVGRVDERGLIELPFTLGKVIASDFYTVSMILISTVTIVFSAAMAQTLRSRMLIQKAIEDLSHDDRYVGKIDMQDYFDSVATPTYTRVAPISQILLGKRQFFGEGKQNPFIRTIATILYIVLKCTTFVFLYFIPIYALINCWNNHHPSSNSTFHISNTLLLILILLAVISMLILFFAELKHIIRVSGKLLFT